ncbi:MAG: hypothetical protein ACR2JF_10860 [Iamia sp.]
MPTPTGPVPASPDDPADRAALVAHASALADQAEAALPGWVVRAVEDRHAHSAGQPAPPEVRTQAQAAGEEAAREVGGQVRELLGRDVDEQATGPLALLRGAVRYPTAVLVAAGVAPLARDDAAVRIHPDDLYDLAPASFADIDPSLQEAGIVWGAAKAHVVLARRRREGLR